jgi:hypothetical protein
MLRLRLSQWLLSVLIPTKGAIAQRTCRGRLPVRLGGRALPKQVSCVSSLGSVQGEPAPNPDLSSAMPISGAPNTSKVRRREPGNRPCAIVLLLTANIEAGYRRHRWSDHARAARSSRNSASPSAIILAPVSAYAAVLPSRSFETSSAAADNSPDVATARDYAPITSSSVSAVQ